MRPIDVIFLTRRDTINTACTLLQSTRHGAQVWMVVPWRARYLRNLLNLKRLKRIAQDAGVDLRLVSAHHETRTLAQEADLSVSYHLPRALRKYEPREIRSTDLGKRVVPTAERLASRYDRAPGKFGFGRVLLSLAFVGLMFGMMGGVVAFFMPQAQVTLEPVSTTEEVVFTARANSRFREVDHEQALMPLRSVQVLVQGSGSTPASASADVPEGYATGVVMFSNRTNETVVVPQGTVVRSGSGETMRFRTTQDVTLPASLGASTRVTISAMEPGYVMAGAFTLNRLDGVLASRVEVLNDTTIQGGSSRRVPMVGYADLDTLHALLVEQLQREAYDQLVQQLTPDEFVPANSIYVEIMSMDYDQAVYQKTETLSGEMKLLVRASAVDEQYLRELARARLVEKVGGGAEIIEDSLQVTRADNVRILDTWIEVDVRASAALVSALDMTTVRNSIRGRTVENAQAWLNDNLALASEPSIDISPEGWPRLPVLAGRLDIGLSTRP